MLKKHLSFILLISAFLSFDKQLNAMHEPEIKTEQAKYVCKQNLCSNTLKCLAAAKCLEVFKAKGIDINDLSYNILPEELKGYCQTCSIIPSLHKHIASLEQFKQHQSNNITEDNLNNYDKLLHELLNKIDISNINLEEILSKISENFQGPSLYAHITLADINALLKLLIQSITIGDQPLSEKELICMNKIWSFICRNDCIDLLKLLVKNRKNNLLPQLNNIIDNNGEYSTNTNFFMFLVSMKIDINLFKYIINQEKHKNYSWKQLFKMHDYENKSILHYAYNPGILEIILELMKEKGLEIIKFINKRKTDGKTPLMIAAQYHEPETVKLLINHGASIELKSNLGQTALDYSNSTLNYFVMIEKDKKMDMGIYKQKIQQCIELLTPKQPKDNQN